MRITTIFVLFMILAGCTQTVLFKYPQPQGKDDLKCIPVKLRGEYMDVSDPDEVDRYVITDTRIYRKDSGVYRNVDVRAIMTEQDFSVGHLVVEIDDAFIPVPHKPGDTSWTITDDGLECSGITIVDKDSSATIHCQMSVSIYDIQTGETVVRKMGRRYFMNTKSNGYWDVDFVKRSGDDLQLYSFKLKQFESEDDSVAIERLRGYVGVEEIQGQHLINPSRWKLRKLIRKGYFQLERTLIKAR